MPRSSCGRSHFRFDPCQSPANAVQSARCQHESGNSPCLPTSIDARIVSTSSTSTKNSVIHRSPGALTAAVKAYKRFCTRRPSSSRGRVGTARTRSDRAVPRSPASLPRRRPPPSLPRRKRLPSPSRPVRIPTSALLSAKHHAAEDHRILGRNSFMGSVKLQLESAGGRHHLV